MEMTPKARVEAVLKGEPADKVPFTIYRGSNCPSSATERKLRNEGLCLVERKNPVFKTERAETKVSTETWFEDGTEFQRTYLDTSAGRLTELRKRQAGSYWMAEHAFKEESDYDKLIALVKDHRYTPCFEEYLAREKLLGEDFICRCDIGSSPLHRLINSFMGIEMFSYEWYDNQERIIELMEAIREDNRKKAKIIADSPVTISSLGGNETAEMEGRERFAEYVVPDYNEVADIFDGKVMLGAHLDGNNNVWKDLVAESGLDFVEAFTPDDTDMTLAEAFEAWPQKILWINFQSSAFLKPAEEIEALTREYIETAKGRRFIIGITEDIPPDRWAEGMSAISKAINDIGEDAFKA